MQSWQSFSILNRDLRLFLPLQPLTYGLPGAILSQQPPIKFSLAHTPPKSSVCTFFAPDTACILLKNFSDSHFCVCEVTWPSCQPLIIVSCYLPPSLDISPLLDKLHTIISILPHNNIIILGDFNFHSPCGIVNERRHHPLSSSRFQNPKLARYQRHLLLRPQPNNF